MSYSACDFVDDVFALIPVSDDAIDEALRAEGIEPEEASDDSRFSAWADCALHQLRTLVGK